ncbi:MAG: zf-HC2 domain-containing protein [bacterium]|nr:zf-HC2 domain-containing protein [bacterium]
MRCGTAREWFTAAVDGELAVRQRQELDAHLAACPACAAERARTARLLGALSVLAADAALPPHLEQDTLRRVRQLAAADRERSAARVRGGVGRWLGLAAPALAAAAVLVLAVRPAPPPVPAVVVEPAASVAPPAPPPVRVARKTTPAPRASGPAAVRPEAPADAPAAMARREAMPSPERADDVALSEPPPELIARPDLYRDLPILQNLEKLENYDAIETTTLDAAHRGPNG